MNLHPGNIFILKDKTGDISDDLVLTDVGLAYFPRYDLKHGISDSFTAPELKNRDDGLSIQSVTDENPGRADLYSVAKIALLLAQGDPDATAEDLGDDFSDEFKSFIENALSE